MKNSLFSTIALFFLSLLIITTYSSCNLLGGDDDQPVSDKCGPAHPDYRTFTAADLSYQGLYNQTVPLGEWGMAFTVNDICAEEHLRVNWKLKMKEGGPYDIYTTFGSVYYAFFYEDTVHWQSQGDLIFTGSQDVGLSHAYGSDPGWVIIDFRFYYQLPWDATPQQIDSVLNRKFEYVEIRMDYYDYKEP